VGSQQTAILRGQWMAEPRLVTSLISIRAGHITTHSRRDSPTFSHCVQSTIAFLSISPFSIWRKLSPLRRNHASVRSSTFTSSPQFREGFSHVRSFLPIMEARRLYVSEQRFGEQDADRENVNRPERACTTKPAELLTDH